MDSPTPDLEPLIRLIIKCAIAVHNAFGPGLLESVYHAAVVMELLDAGLDVKSSEHVPLFYKGKQLSADLTLDILVNDSVVVEVKAVEQLHSVHVAQVITYLKLTGHRVGLLINFNTTSLRNGGIRRVTHPDLYGGVARTQKESF
jgi:GxxExxY protein